MMKPQQSWVARWQKQGEQREVQCECTCVNFLRSSPRLLITSLAEKLKAGLYAIQVFGTTAMEEIGDGEPNEYEDE